jgi:hypothetical protein
MISGIMISGIILSGIMMIFITQNVILVIGIIRSVNVCHPVFAVKVMHGDNIPSVIMRSVVGVIVVAPILRPPLEAADNNGD